MSSATGFFLSIGIGIGVALFADSSWWWQGLIGVILITVIHIVTKSELYKDSVEECNSSGAEFSLKKFALFTIFSNAFVAFVAFGIVRLLI